LSLCGLAGWVNRFANAGDTAAVVAENAAVKVCIFYFSLVVHFH
jgi:hypothetical protein